MKVVLKTGQEYQVTSVFEANTTQICIAFTEIEDYGTLRHALTEESLEEVKFYSDDTSYIAYEGYVKFIKSSVVETEDGLDIAMYFEKIDSTTRYIKETKAMLETLNKQVNPVIDIETCTLEELKAWQVNQSKKNLEVYLECNPIKSSAHGNTDKYYSITMEKQSLLTQMILVTQLAIQSEVEYQPSWNAASEACTYDWTLKELQQLAFEIESVVRPLVSHQQTMESEIYAATSKEDVISISITF